MLLEMLSSPLMQRGLIIALLVGIRAPVVGTYLVQRRLTLMGDGIGHIALTGVALGWLSANFAGATNQDAWAIPGAILTSILGALAIEWMRSKGHTSGDVALALLFYGGIAGGVFLIALAGGTSANLSAYLFGSITTVTPNDVWITLLLFFLIIGVGIGLRPALFVLCHDAEFARASGLPVPLLSALISVIAALTVSLAMRVVGVLLVSALMIIPVAASQLVARSFKHTMRLAMFIGATVSLNGLSLTYFYPWSPGATIVLLAVLIYLILALTSPLIGRFNKGLEYSDPHLPAAPDSSCQAEQGSS